MTISVSGFDKCTCNQTENPNHVHGWEPAPRSLRFALRPFRLVECRIGHGNAGSINESELPPMPEIPLRDMLLHSINEMCVDLIQHVEGQFVACLAIGAGGLADRRAFSACRFASQEGREGANRLATGAIGRLNLMEKSPENDIQGKNATASLYSKCVLRKQFIWNVGGKKPCGDGKRNSLARTWQKPLLPLKLEVFQKEEDRNI